MRCAIRLRPEALAALLALTLVGCGPRRLGWIEPVCVVGVGELQAKLDTGAVRTSLDAQSLEFFEREGANWLRFRVGQNGPLLELPLQGEARVRRQNAPAQERPLVPLSLELAGERVEVIASLANREGYELPLLIGRDGLAGRFTVDSAVKSTTRADCEG